MRVRIGSAAILLFCAWISSIAGCGRRHVSYRVEVIAHVRVVDAVNGTGIEGAEVLVGSFLVDDPGWRSKQLAEHQRDPLFRILGLSGHALTGPGGQASIHYNPHMSGMEEGLARGAPRKCPLSRVWVACKGYESRVLRVDSRNAAVEGESGWTYEVHLPDVLLTRAED